MPLLHERFFTEINKNPKFSENPFISSDVSASGINCIDREPNKNVSSSPTCEHNKMFRYMIDYFGN